MAVSGAAPGWFFYSIERFYDGPLVFNATCSAQDGALAFSTVNAFKQANVYGGTYTVTDASSGDEVASGELAFAAHWRATNVTVASSFSSGAEYTLEVKNQWNYASQASVTC